MIGAKQGRRAVGGAHGADLMRERRGGGCQSRSGAGAGAVGAIGGACLVCVIAGLWFDVYMYCTRVREGLGKG